MKLECEPKFCYLGDTVGAEGGVDEGMRQLELECDVFGLSARSYRPF